MTYTVDDAMVWTLQPISERYGALGNTRCHRESLIGLCMGMCDSRIGILFEHSSMCWIIESLIGHQRD